MVEGPLSELEENQTVIGVLPDRLKRLFALRRYLGEELRATKQRFQEELDAIDSIKEVKALGERARQVLEDLREQSDFVNGLFWMECRRHFQDLLPNNAGSFGVAKDYQFYWEPKPELCNSGGLFDGNLIGAILA